MQECKKSYPVPYGTTQNLFNLRVRFIVYRFRAHVVLLQRWQPSITTGGGSFYAISLLLLTNGRVAQQITQLSEMESRRLFMFLSRNTWPKLVIPLGFASRKTHQMKTGICVMPLPWLHTTHSPMNSNAYLIKSIFSFPYRMVIGG